MTEQKPGKKRVVPKAQYVRHLVEKATFGSVGGILFLIGILGFFAGVLAAMTVLICSVVFWKYTQTGEVATILRVLLLCLGTAGVSSVFLIFGYRALNKAHSLEPVVPLTRHNANQLPPEESLLRGSEQPLQTETLLRAAQSEETPADQLLRPDT